MANPAAPWPPEYDELVDWYQLGCLTGQPIIEPGHPGHDHVVTVLDYMASDPTKDDAPAPSS